MGSERKANQGGGTEKGFLGRSHKTTTEVAARPASPRSTFEILQRGGRENDCGGQV